MAYDRILHYFIFWGVWLVIPFLWEIFTGIISSILVTFKYFKKQEDDALDYYPYVSIIVPVYNSQKTLKKCLDGIYNQNYPIERIEVFLINNGSTDDSFGVFTSYQEGHPMLKLWWHEAEQGKSKALNAGIFSSRGKYIINIDSDGYLDRDAVVNIVRRFESDGEITCMTGVILTDIDEIEKTKGRILKIVRLNELFEYAEGFLVGRNFQSIFNSMYTLAGAFSCFRKQALVRTQMYNSETIGEDAHMTFQLKDFIGGKIKLCENAFFFVEPIENLDRLYIQRQRWQRAELEVATLFTKSHLGGLGAFITKPSMRKLVSDHTLTFPRLIWIFAMIYLYFINYPLETLLGANFLLYLSYVINSFTYLGVSGLYLKEQKRARGYLFKYWYMCFVLPVYRFIVYWMRVAGIINSLTTRSRWSTKTLSEEVKLVKEKFLEERKKRLPIIDTLKRFINNG